MKVIKQLIIVGLCLLSYMFAYLSAVIPGILWWVIGGFLVIVGFTLVGLYRSSNLGVLAVGIFTNGVFLTLGQYLYKYVEGIQFLVVIFGYCLSIIVGIGFYYFKENQKDVTKLVKQERKEEIQSNSLKENLAATIHIIKKLVTNIKKYGFKLGIKMTVVEEEEIVVEESNSMDFILGVKVELERREY